MMEGVNSSMNFKNLCEPLPSTTIIKKKKEKESEKRAVSQESDIFKHIIFREEDINKLNMKEYLSFLLSFHVP
jgi:hypothetical protein